MKKISSLFSRDPNNPRVLTDQFHPAAAWVVVGDGIATRKWDGTAVCIDTSGVLFARYDAKHGKPPPPDFVPAQPDPDPNTGHHPGWVPATRPQDRWIREAFDLTRAELGWSASEMRGTWEACGPKIGGNPEQLASHKLLRHGDHLLHDVPRDRDGLIAYFADRDIEGVVWWRDVYDPGCDKIKITGAALGVRRGGR